MISFDDTTHKYTLDGKVIPSVTQIIQDVLKGESGYTGNTYARDFGSCVHKTLELYDKGNLGDYDERMSPYIKAWDKFLIDYKVKIVKIEEIGYSAQHSFAGTVDRVCTIKKEWTIIDIKTGKPYKEHPLQTMGYAILEENTNINRMCVYLSELEYTIERHTNPEDLTTFLACLQVWKWRKNKLC